MFKIEKECEGQTTIIRLCGRIRSTHIDGIQAEMDGQAVPVVLDLSDVTLVDIEAVRFLSERENAGVELVHCPAYIREWIIRERAEGA